MLHMGIDLHKSYSYVVVDDGGHKLDGRKLENHTLADYVCQFKEPVRATFEATRNWSCIYDLLQPHVVELVMAHPKNVKAIAAARIKTDRIDAQTLAHLLRVDMLPAAYAPPPAIRDLRDMVRHRAGLVRQRTRLKNRIHALLARYWLTKPAGGLFTKRGMSYLRTCELRSPHREMMDDYLDLLEAYNQRIKKADRNIANIVQERGDAQRLTTIPGIGNYSALAIIAELGELERFATPKQVCSYAGLVPSVHSSGGKTRHGPITKEGSTWLRGVIVEAAQSTVRHSPYFRRYRARLAFRNGRNAAKVASARKLLTIIYWMLKRGEPYRENTPASVA